MPRLGLLVLIHFLVFHLFFSDANASVDPQLKSSSPAQSFSSGEPSIRVRLSYQSDQARVLGWDLRLFDWQNKRLFPSAKDRVEIEIKCSPQKILLKWNGESLESYSDLSFDSPAGQITLGSKPYPSRLKLYLTPSGECEWVAIMGIETYLEGVVSGEFSSKWSPQAVQAQVIAARSYALATAIEKRKNPKSRFDVESSVADQVYQSLNGSDFLAARAVKNTKGLVLTDLKGELVKTFYHSTCGGKTSSAFLVWGKGIKEFSGGVECPYCQSSPRFYWKNKMSFTELSQKLIAGLKQKRLVLSTDKVLWLGPNHEVELPKARYSTIMLKLSINNKPVFMPVLASWIREWIGTEIIRSTRFNWEFTNQGNQIEISGVGNGHGVGMCQWGAKVMGSMGFKHKQILAKYYPGLRLLEKW